MGECSNVSTAVASKSGTAERVAMTEPGTVDIGELNRQARQRSLGTEARESLSAAADAVREEVERGIATWRASGLSRGEAVVAAYRELGFTNRTIAHITGLSPSTVDDHQHTIAVRYDEAKRLVGAVESSPVGDVRSDGWACHRCGHDNDLSQIPITRDLEDGRTDLRCFGCRAWTTVQAARRSG